MMYGFRDIECDRIFFILVHFLPFYPPNNPKNQNFGKIKKKIIIISYTAPDIWYMTDVTLSCAC